MFYELNDSIDTHMINVEDETKERLYQHVIESLEPMFDRNEYTMAHVALAHFVVQMRNILNSFPEFVMFTCEGFPYISVNGFNRRVHRQIFVDLLTPVAEDISTRLFLTFPDMDERLKNDMFGTIKSLNIRSEYLSHVNIHVLTDFHLKCIDVKSRLVGDHRKFKFIEAVINHISELIRKKGENRNISFTFDERAIAYQFAQLHHYISFL